MRRVQIVNAQSIDGCWCERDEVVEVDEGRARDLVNAGKARIAPVEEPDMVPVEEAAVAVEKPKPGQKGGK